MSKFSTISTLKIADARCATDPTLYAGYTKPDGSSVDHRAVVPVYVNLLGRKGKDGVRREGKTLTFRLTAWGKAALDLCLHVQTGKELSFEAELDQYKQPVMRDGMPILNSDGGEVIVERFHLVLEPQTIRYGDSCAKFIAEGLGNGTIAVGYDGTIPVNMIQAAWAQGPEAMSSLIALAMQGPEREKQMRAAWNSQTFKPGVERFGYAKVVYKTPVSAYNNTDAGPNTNSTAAPVYTPPTYTQAPVYNTAVPPAPPITGIPTAPVEKTVDGFTREQMLAHGWTDETLLTGQNGHFSALSKLGNNAANVSASTVI